MLDLRNQANKVKKGASLLDVPYVDLEDSTVYKSTYLKVEMRKKDFVSIMSRNTAFGVGVQNKGHHHSMPYIDLQGSIVCKSTTEIHGL